MASTSVRVVLMTFPAKVSEAQNSEKISSVQAFAHALVSQRFVACVNLIDALTSIYRWQDAVCQDSEVMLVAKTTEDKLPELRAWVMAHHPYECPAFVVLSVTCDSAAPYLDWV
ncbi:MAG: divalent-cation tolerance protein CutA, partial [Vampirovibrionales bacterium]|nr:divalent-cation tolerance protein CutA [Vampirovibrionales bacterium]